MNGDDWRFDRTGLDRGYNSRTGALAPAPLTAPVTAISRIIPPPSNTNWNSAFVNNQPASPSKTDWQKTFGITPGERNGPTTYSELKAAGFPGSYQENEDTDRFLKSLQPFSFDLSRSSDAAQLSLDWRTPATDFYKDRAANLDLTSRDYELYGAGKDFSFNW